MSYNNIIKFFPNEIQDKLIPLFQTNKNIEEIRIRINLPIILKIDNDEKMVNHIITREEINEILERICENSLYSYQHQISNGYITINGGHRVGIVGSAVVKNNEIINLNYISSLNFRISRQVIGCSNNIIGEILNKHTNNIYNTLIVSPPGMGKTTLLKDIIRNISNGIDDFNGINVTVVDERGELGACYKGISQNDLGIRTDILNDMPKSIGMKMAIRSMAPKVIVADEIGSVEDGNAIKYASCCGIKGIFTAHGLDIKDLSINPALKDLIDNKIFERIIIIKSRQNSNLEKEILKVEENYKLDERLKKSNDYH